MSSQLYLLFTYHLFVGTPSEQEARGGERQRGETTRGETCEIECREILWLIAIDVAISSNSISIALFGGIERRIKDLTESVRPLPAIRQSKLMNRYVAGSFQQRRFGKFRVGSLTCFPSVNTLIVPHIKSKALRKLFRQTSIECASTIRVQPNRFAVASPSIPPRKHCFDILRERGTRKCTNLLRIN